MKRQEQLQQTTTISAHEKLIIHRNLERTLKWLEVYIEKAKFYPNWKGQVSKETITRTDIPSASVEKVKDTMNTVLVGLETMTNNKPEFLLGGVQEEFYSWLEQSGINADNCPMELANSLIDIHNVLIGQGKDFSDEQGKIADENIAKMSAEEKERHLSKLVSAIQNPLEKTRAEEQSMQGQTYRDVKVENSFFGNAERGQIIFAQIKSMLEANTPREVSGSHEGDEVTVRNNNEELIYEAAADEVEVNQLSNQLSSDERYLIEQEKQKNANNRSGDDKYWLLGGGSLLVAIGGWGAWLFRKKLT